jgi:cysteine desulfurase
MNCKRLNPPRKKRSRRLEAVEYRKWGETLQPARYFDHAATTPLRREVLAAMEPYWTTYFGNPSSLHQFGLPVKHALEQARETIAQTIGARPREIVFTGSGTEADNIAVLGGARYQRQTGKGNHVIVSQIEHPAVLQAARALEQEGFTVTYLPVDGNGRVSVEELAHHLRPETVLVSIMHANNVTGTVQPIREIGALLRERNILFHTDAIQSYGKIPVDVEELQVDLLSINAHKIGGPKGVAALYVRKGIRVSPLVHGGGQERGIRPATPNVPGIVGFAKAAELAVSGKESERLSRLRARLLDKLSTTIQGLKVNGHKTACLPHILNISVPQIEGQALMLELDRLGFATSSGSACSAGNHEPSYVLLAMGISSEQALESLRISMGDTTTEEAVDELADALLQVVNEWRRAHNIPFTR